MLAVMQMMSSSKHKNQYILLKIILVNKYKYFHTKINLQNKLRYYNSSYLGSMRMVHRHQYNYLNII